MFRTVLICFGLSLDGRRCREMFGVDTSTRKLYILLTGNGRFVYLENNLFKLTLEI